MRSHRNIIYVSIPGGETSSETALICSYTLFEMTLMKRSVKVKGKSLEEKKVCKPGRSPGKTHQISELQRSHGNLILGVGHFGVVGITGECPALSQRVFLILQSTKKITHIICFTELKCKLS